MPAFDRPGDERDGDRAEQQVNKRILELRQQTPPDGNRRRCAKLVRTVFRETPPGLSRSKPTLEVRVEHARDLGGVQNGGVGQLVVHADDHRIRDWTRYCKVQLTVLRRLCTTITV